jgi:Putative beta-barrel porin-2, OmpL-like. bbp2
MLQKIFATGIVLSLFISGIAQEVAVSQSTQPAVDSVINVTEEEKKPALSITGGADAYWRYDFGKTRMNNLTSFTNSHNAFELGMATVKLEHKTEKVGVVVDLGFGKRAQEFSYNDQGILAAIKQLYVTYSPATWVKFTAGSWATHVGYELVDAQFNRNYSMSYMFTNGPFFHTGLKADFTAGKHGFMLGVANPTDYKYVPDGQINRKAFLAQYSVAFTDNVKAYLNYVGSQAPMDSSKSSQFDLVLTGKVSDKFSLGYNGTVNSMKYRQTDKYSDAQSWWASALYLNVDPTTKFGLTLRGEYFSDKNAIKMFNGYTDGGSIFATTLSANLRIHSFVIIPEFRVDSASESIFQNKSGSSKSSFASFMIAAVYGF